MRTGRKLQNRERIEKCKETLDQLSRFMGDILDGKLSQREAAKALGLTAQGLSHELDSCFKQYLKHSHVFSDEDIRNLLGDVETPAEKLAKDVLQETYYVAYKKWDILCEHSNPMGWLINTAKNKIRELNKSLKKIECEVDLDADEYTFTEDGYGKSELDLIITKGLTEEEKNRFYKYFLHGYSISELAQLEKISENNMSVRISRLRSKIAQNIPDESGIDKKYKKSVRIDKKESCT